MGKGKLGQAMNYPTIHSVGMGCDTAKSDRNMPVIDATVSVDEFIILFEKSEKAKAELNKAFPFEESEPYRKQQVTYNVIKFLQEVLCATLNNIKIIANVNRAEVKCVTITIDGSIGGVKIHYVNFIQESCSCLLMGDNNKHILNIRKMISFWPLGENRDPKDNTKNAGKEVIEFRLTEELLCNPKLLLAHSNDTVRNFMTCFVDCLEE